MGQVSSADIRDFVKKHPDGIVKTGYDKSHANYEKFDKWYEQKCGGSITTNRNNTYTNTDKNDPNRLTRHGRWALGQVLKADARNAAKVANGEAAKPAAEAAKPDGEQKPGATPSVRGNATTPAKPPTAARK